LNKRQLYLGITSIYPNIELLDLNVNTSLISVTLDHDKIEQIRQSRGISANGIANKIGLSRSRYYRWLNYEVDLPLDLLMGVQKLLGLTNIEMWALFSQPNDELIQITAMLAYYALIGSSDKCHIIGESLLKHNKTTLKNDPYLLLIDFASLCVIYVDNNDFQTFEVDLSKVIDTLIFRDMWTTIDIIMLVSIVYMNPKKMMPFFGELSETIYDKSTVLTSNQKVGFLYDLLCIAVKIKHNPFILDILKKIHELEPWINDWEIKLICQLNDSMLNHWQDKNLPNSEIEDVLTKANDFDNSKYKQKICDLIDDYGNF